MKTNFDKIKNMTVDELVEWQNQTEQCGCIYDKECCGDELDQTKCRKGIKQWLLKECEE